MTPDDLQRRLAVSGINCRVKGDEVQVQVCPYCGNDRWNMEINVVNGMAKCWACRSPRPGRADTVISLLTGDSSRIEVIGGRSSGANAPPPSSEFRKAAIDQIPSAARYLEKRGIDLAMARNFELGVCLEKDHLLENRIVIPARDFWNGDLVGWVGRSYTGAKPKYLSTMPTSSPITGWRVPGRVPCVVVEGHLDGLAVRRAGYSAAALSGVHGPGFLEWAARMDPKISILVMLDGSAVAEAQSLFWELVTLRNEGIHLVTLGEYEDPASIGPGRIQEIVKRLVSNDPLHLTTQKEDVL